MRAAIYLRQSKDQHLDGLAVERQRQDCLALAADRGWTVARVLIDNDTSASTGVRRAGYEELLRLADAQAIDVIVCWHIDRLTRRITDLEDVIERCQRANVKVATVSGDLDLSTDAGRLVGRILASVARGEVERKSARQRRAGQQSAESGRPAPGGRGGRPYGYALGGMELNAPEAEVLRDAYAQLLAGSSLSAITARLNDAGHRTTAGNQWRPNVLRRLLLNPRNAALRTYHGEEVGLGEWPPIVPEETYRAVASLLTDPARRTQEGTARRWLGGGLFLCGRCGSDVKVAYRDGNVRAYQCRASKHLSRVADPVDTFVTGTIVEWLSRADVADLLIAEAPEVAGYRDEAAKLRRQLDQLAADYADGNLTARQVKVATDRIEARLERAERDLAAAGRAARLSPVATAPDPAAAWLALDVSAQRAVIDALCTVTLLPAPPGRRAFDPNTVRIAPKQ